MMEKFAAYTSKQKQIAAAVAALLLIGGYGAYRYFTTPPAEEKIIPYVRTVTVGAIAPAAAAEYPGELQGRYESKLAFQVSGKINARLVNVGDRVTAGQLLMSIDPKDVNQSVEAANAALSSAIANQKLAADNARRFNTLYEGGAVSAATRDQYNTQLDAANATLRQAQAQANASHNQLEYTELRSDADGVIAALAGEVGQVAAAGNPVATVVREGEREVRINVPENALGQLRLDTPAKIGFWALPDVQATGHVREIAPMADPVTKTYKVCVLIDNLPEQARLGMTAKVSFTTEQSAEAGLLLPAAAIYQVTDKPQVWVLRNNHVQLVDIAIGGYTGNNVSITSGLQKGDIVVTAGLSKLAPNQEVRLAEDGEQK